MNNNPYTNSNCSPDPNSATAALSTHIAFSPAAAHASCDGSGSSHNPHLNHSPSYSPTPSGSSPCSPAHLPGNSDSTNATPLNDYIGRLNSLQRHHPPSNLRVASINIGNKGGEDKPQLAAELCLDLNIDVCALQEIGLAKHTFPFFQNKLRAQGLQADAAMHSTRTQYNGTALLYNQRLAMHKHKQPWTWAGRAVGVCFRFRGNVKLWVFSVYVPTDPRNAGKDEAGLLWRDLSRKLQTITAKPNRYVILLGDFNAVIDPSIDRLSTNAINSLTPETPMLQSLLTRGYADAYRIVHPLEHSEHFTHSGRRDGTQQSRLDMCFTSSTLTTSILNSDVILNHDSSSKLHSNHLPLVTDISTVGWCDQWAQSHATHQAQHRAQQARERSLVINVHAGAEMWKAFSERSAHIVTEDMKRTATCVRAGSGSAAQRLARVEELGMQLTASIVELAKETLGTRRRFCTRKVQASRPTRTRCQQLGRVAALRRHGRPEAEVVELARQCLRNDPLVPPQDVVHSSAHYEAWFASITAALVEERTKAKKQARKVKHDLICAAQRKRCEDLFSNLGGFVRNAMGKARDKVDINRVAVDGPLGKEYSGDPATVLSEVRRVFSEWTGPRNPRVQQLLQDPFWQAIYQPRDDLAADTWDSLLCPVSDRELSHLLHGVAGGKAPGPSQLSYDLLRSAHSTVQRVLLALVNEVLRIGDMPRSWLQHDISPIPKPGWGGDINRTRPISLVEVLRKVVEKVLNTRLAAILESKKVLLGDNAGFMPRSGLDELLWMLRGILDDAKKEEKQLWLILLDIQRAYDHVSWEGVEPALTRIRAPERFIGLLRNMWSKRTARVLTAVGMTSVFTVHNGLAQGAVLSPLMWNIFYDPLLTALKTTRGYSISRGIKVTHSAFADDTQIVASSKQEALRMLRVAAPFFELQDVRMHPDKFEVFAFFAPPQDTTAGLQFPTLSGPAGPTIRVSTDHKQGFTILGATMALNDSGASQRRKIDLALSTACSNLRNKTLTDKQIAYLVKRVILPSIQHTLKATLHSPTECHKLDQRIRSLVKSKSSLPGSVGSWLLYSPHLYEYATLMDLQAETAIASLFYVLNTPGRMHDFACARLEKIASEDQLGYLPHTRPYVLQKHCSQDYLRATIGFMAERRCSFQSQLHSPSSLPSQPFRITLREIVSKDTFSKWGSIWASKGFVFLEQVVTTDGQRLRSEADLNPTQRTRHHRPWYAALSNAICEVTGPALILRHDIVELLAICLRLEEDSQPHSRYLKPPTNRTRTLQEVGFGAQTTDLLQPLRSACPPTTTWENCFGQLGGSQGASLCCLATLYPSSPFNWPAGVQQRPSWLSEQAHFAPPEEEEHFSESDWLAFSDGSLKDSRSRAARAGAGVTFVRPKGLSHSLRLSDARSSASSEAGALLAALASIPISADCEIRLDNQAVVQKAQQIIAGDHCSVRRQINQFCSSTWEGFRQLASSRTGQTQVTWVRGHADDADNIEADRLAKKGADQDLQGPIVPAFGLRYKFYLDKQLVEGNPSQIVKRVHLRRSWLLWRSYTSAWLFRYIPLEVLELWALRKGTMRTSWADCARRSFVIKLWTDNLPTLARRARDRPDLYSNGNCKRCNAEEAEDVAHLWACSAARATRERIALELRKELVRLAQALGSPKIRTPCAWTASKFPWLARLQQGFPDNSEQDKVLMRGILPLRSALVLASYDCPEHKLVKSWKTLQQRFVEMLHELWKERCEDTAAWERNEGITRNQKRQPRPPMSAEAPSSAQCAICYDASHVTIRCPLAQNALARAGRETASLWLGRAPDAAPISSFLAKTMQDRQQQQQTQQPASSATACTASNSQPLAG